MFNLPTLPTDSLYKFSFIAGLIICLFSMYWFIGSVNYVNRKVNVADSLLNKLKSTMSIDSLEGFPNSTKIYDKLSKKEAAQLWRKNQDILINEVTQLRALEYSSNSTNGSYSQVKNDYIFFIIGEVLGGFMMVFNGILWLLKIQIPQDRLLQIQVELAEKELENAKIKYIANKYNRNYVPNSKG